MTEQKPRRPKGTGSIYERDGVVIGQYEVHTPEGKSKRKVGSKLAKAIAGKDKGLVFDCGSMTVGEFLDEWLDSIRASLRPGALRRYEESARIHIKPTFGKVRLDRLDALRIQSLYCMKLDSGLSPRTVQIIHATLHRALKQAVSWSLISRNVTESVSPPNSPKKEIKPLTRGQVKDLLEAAKGNKLEALYILAITTGLRQGGATGTKVGGYRPRRRAATGTPNRL